MLPSICSISTRHIATVQPDLMRWTTPDGIDVPSSGR